MSDFTEEQKDFIRAELAASETRTREFMRDIETRLLTAFQQWASPAEIKLRSHRDSIHGLEVTLDSLTDRVSDLERKSRPQ